MSVLLVLRHQLEPSDVLEQHQHDLVELNATQSQPEVLNDDGSETLDLLVIECMRDWLSKEPIHSEASRGHRMSSNESGHV